MICVAKTSIRLCGYMRSRLHGLIGASHMLNWAAPSAPDAVNILAPYQGSPWTNIDAMLDSAGFKPGDRVLDLGAGDARVLIRAMQRGASMVEGWELSSDVHAVGVQHISASFEGKYDDCAEVRFLLGDARSAKPFEFDIVTMFLLPYGLSVLGPWLQRCHRENVTGRHSRIVSQGWPLFGDLTVAGSSDGLQLRDKVTVPSGAVMFVYS